MSIAKKHHFLSQFYLKRFTLENNKKGIIFRYDIKSKDITKTKPINEGYVKYFNKLESNIENQNILENELSKIESDVSKIFDNIIKHKTLPQDKNLMMLLIYYVTLLGVRNPQRRKNFRNYQELRTKKFFYYLLNNKTTWERYTKNIPILQDDKYQNISYEEMKSFIFGKTWKLHEPNEKMVLREFKAVEEIYKLLITKNWSLIIIDNNKKFFVTSDNPVKNIIKNDDFLQFRDAFALCSELFFPISRNIMLKGSYKEEPKSIIANNNLIEQLNYFQLLYTDRFIYSPVRDFTFLNYRKTLF